MLRTFEAKIAEKIRTSSLGKKLGVLIKKGVCVLLTFENHTGRTYKPTDKWMEITSNTYAMAHIKT